MSKYALIAEKFGMRALDSGHVSPALFKPLRVDGFDAPKLRASTPFSGLLICTAAKETALRPEGAEAAFQMSGVKKVGLVSRAGRVACAPQAPDLGVCCRGDARTALLLSQDIRSYFGSGAAKPAAAGSVPKGGTTG